MRLLNPFRDHKLPVEASAFRIIPSCIIIVHNLPYPYGCAFLVPIILVHNPTQKKNPKSVLFQIMLISKLCIVDIIFTTLKKKP